jgi:hypothetical protein
MHEFATRVYLSTACSRAISAAMQSVTRLFCSATDKSQSEREPKRPIACSVPAPMLFSQIFFTNACLLYAVLSVSGSFIGDDETPLPFHAAEIPLPSGVEIELVAGGFSRDLDVVAEMKAVGGSIG